MCVAYSFNPALLMKLRVSGFKVRGCDCFFFEGNKIDHVISNECTILKDQTHSLQHRQAH